MCCPLFCRFYEWKKDGSKKQPYYVHFKDGRPLVLAALYDSWKNAEGGASFYYSTGSTPVQLIFRFVHIFH